MLDVQQLSCIRQHRTLFSSLCFQLEAGELLIVEGENGAGKSSLLRLIAGLATPAAGQILWQNQLIHSLRQEYWSHLHYVSHQNGIKLGLSVYENLCLSQHLELSTSDAFDATLSLLQLQNYKHTLAQYLSAGQKRRIALAKLFLFTKKLWILDEPLTALDSQTQTLFLAELEKHLKQGGMAIISTHQPLVLKAPIKSLRLKAC